MWLFDSKLSIWWLPRKEHIKVQVQPGARDGIGIVTSMKELHDERLDIPVLSVCSVV
jgi:hypothetical protein